MLLCFWSCLIWLLNFSPTSFDFEIFHKVQIFWRFNFYWFCHQKQAYNFLMCRENLSRNSFMVKFFGDHASMKFHSIFCKFFASHALKNQLQTDELMKFLVSWCQKLLTVHWRSMLYLTMLRNCSKDVWMRLRTFNLAMTSFMRRWELMKWLRSLAIKLRLWPVSGNLVVSKKLVKISGGNDTSFFWLDNVNYDEKVPCGRPLVIEFDTISDSLIVMHSFQGIFQVDLKTGSKKQLVSEKEIIGVEVFWFLKTF